MVLIAEVKTRSPFGWSSEMSWTELFTIAEEVGDIISIHTDERWGGSFDLVKQARALTTKPILAKGIHADDKDIASALAAGADLVLVVGRLPSVYLDQCLLEPNSLAELMTLPVDSKVVWNSRDLATGGLKSETFAEARSCFSGWLCQASNIRDISDIDSSADAVLVGTNIARLAKDKVRLRNL